MSLTTKTLEHVVPAYNSLRGRVIGRGKVAEAAQQTAEAEAPHAALAAQPLTEAASDSHPGRLAPPWPWGINNGARFRLRNSRV